MTYVYFICLHVSFKGAKCDNTSPLDVVVLRCTYTKTNWLRALPQFVMSLPIVDVIILLVLHIAKFDLLNKFV